MARTPGARPDARMDPRRHPVSQRRLPKDGDRSVPAIRLIDLAPAALCLCSLSLAIAGLFGGIGPLSLDRLETAADSRLQNPAPPSEDLRQAERLTEKLLAQRPGDASAWLRLAYIERARRTSLSMHAQALIMRSYELEPLGPELTRWRLSFLFENWNALSPSLRARAMAELSAVFPRHGWALRNLPASIQDPQGRMVAFMAFSRLRAEVNLDGTTHQRSRT